MIRGGGSKYQTLGQRNWEAKFTDCLTKQIEEKIKRAKRFGCGKELNPGDKAVHLWGLLLCPDCAEKKHHPFMAVYSEGKLEDTWYCGEIVK